MNLKEEIKDDIAIITLTGELMDGPDVMPFHDHIKQLVASGTNRVIVDFSAVRWFGSAMLGVLTASLATVKAAGGDLRLVGITRRIESILIGHVSGFGLPNVQNGEPRYGQFQA